MADRYWVGGSGTWNTTSTTNWATSSGGSAGASAPTAADDVFFDANSNVGTGAFTVTISSNPVCNNITIGGPTSLDGAMTLALGSSNLFVSGSWTNPATNFSTTGTSGTINFNATTTGKTITTNGVAINAGITFNGVGGAWTLGSALNVSGFIVTVTNGTFNTSASNYAVTASAFVSSNSNTRAITLNGSTITLASINTPWNTLTTTGLTFNAGTSTIVCTAVTPTFSGGGLTYYNVSFTSTTPVTNSNWTDITGANTFNNLSFSTPSSASLTHIEITANQTITGTLTATGANGSRRLFFRSDTVTLTRTLTCAAVSLIDVDFQDITIAGAASPATGTRLGNAGGNSGITFTAAKTVYWNLALGGNWTDNGWALTSGGTPAATNYPLPQDTAVIQNTGLNSGSTITFNGQWNVGTLSFGTRTNAMTLASGANETSVYGDVTFGSGITTTGIAAFIFSNRSIKTFNSGGITLTQSVQVDAPSGGVILAAALNTGTSNINITRGTFDTSASNYSVTANSFISNNSNTRTITLNGSTITLSSTTPWGTATTTGLTFNAGLSTINLSNVSSLFAGGGLTYYNVSFTSTTASSSTKSITGANTFNNLTFSTISSVGLNNISISADQTINGTLTVNGSNGNRRMFVRSNTVESTRTLTCAAVSLTDVDFRDITIAGAASPATGTRLGDCGGNSNITFVAGKTVYWSLVGGGNWTDDGWAPGSGGTPATTEYPLPQDTAIIENTGLNSGAIIAISAFLNIGTLDASTRTNAMTLASGANSPTFYGNFTYGAGVTPTGTGTYTFSNRATKTLDSGGKTFTQDVWIEAPGGGIQLVTNNLTLGTTRTTYLQRGTLDLNNRTLTTGIFQSNNTNVRSIAFGTTGNIVLAFSGAPTTNLSMATATNFTFTGTSNISAAMNASRTFNFGDTAGATDSNRPNLNITSGNQLVTLTGSFRQINFTGSTPSLGPQIVNCHGFTLASAGTFTSATFNMVGSGTLTYNGKTISTLNINGTGITTTLASAGQNGTTTLTNGTLDLAGFTLTSTTTAATAAGTKNLTFNGGTLVCSAATTTAWNNANPTGFTTTAGTGTGTISMTSSAAKTFVGGGSTYNCTLRQGGVGTLTITGANTFNDITRTSATASQITFPASTTTTVNNFTLSGTAGNLVSLRSSTPGTQFTLSKASGAVFVSYLNIQDSNATGGATWNAYLGNGNVDSGNNTGWYFSPPGAFIAFFTP